MAFLRRLKRILTALTAAVLFACFFAGLAPSKSRAIETYADPEKLAAFTAAVDSGLSLYSKNIDISALAIHSSEIVNFAQAYRNSAPLSFLMATKYSYSLSGQTVGTLKMSYADGIGSKDDVTRLIGVYTSAVDAIVSGIREEWPAEAKLLYLNDWFCCNYIYDFDYAVADAYGLVSGRKGVCQAFTLLAKGVLDRLGIENDTVTSNNLDHIWNRVKLGDNWYHIDFTWSNRNVRGYCYHDHFLRGEENFNVSHVKNEKDWISCFSAEDCGPDTYYDSGALWYGSNSAFVFSGGFWFFSGWDAGKPYIAATRDFYNVDARIFFDDLWYSDGARYSYYPKSYSCIKALGRYVLFSGAEGLYVLDTSNSVISAVADSAKLEISSPESIYGMEDLGGSVLLTVRTKPPTGGAGWNDTFVKEITVEIPSGYVPGEASAALAALVSYEQVDGKFYIFGVPAGTSEEVFLNTVAGSKDGNSIADNGLVGTGTVVSFGNADYTVSVAGDVDGDGDSDSGDAGRLIKALLNPEEYRVTYRQDYNGDGNFDADDAVYLQKHASEPESFPVAVK